MGPKRAGEVALGDAISAEDGVFQDAPGVLREALEIKHVALHLGGAVLAGKAGLEEGDGVFLRQMIRPAFVRGFFLEARKERKERMCV